MRPKPIIASLLALLLSGCSVIGYMSPKFWYPPNRRDSIDLLTESFAANLRWGRYDVAAAHIAPDQRIAFLKLVRDPQAPVRFTDYEVLSVELGPGMSEARALVHFKLHRLPSMTETAFVDEQVWRYYPKRMRWFLEPELAAYRDAGKPLARR